MSPIFLGIDCGATTSKINGVDQEGNQLTEVLRQTPTPSEQGRGAILAAWVRGIDTFLAGEQLSWDQLAGVGVAMPGPYLDYGILGPMPNMSDKVTGWTYLKDLDAALREKTGRHIPVATANDGQLAGVPEARLLQAETPGSVLMLSLGSGLGCSYVDAQGSPLGGDHQAAVILSHMPFPFHLLDLPRFTCGCGRDWGCVESYTSISGLTQYLDHLLPRFPEHPFHEDSRPRKQQALSLRTMAQQNDPLALAIFDLQARAMGIAVAMGAMAYDITHVVIGGGLMDPGATTPAFRQRYLNGIRSAAAKHLWVQPDPLHYHAARLGEHAQAIGAALLVQRSIRKIA
jgi:glucokinase